LTSLLLHQRIQPLNINKKKGGRRVGRIIDTTSRCSPLLFRIGVNNGQSLGRR
jgi:4-hydroxy-3-methylbut-2-en-1-yl diphosphate synthase IspG/GcpE